MSDFYFNVLKHIIVFTILVPFVYLAYERKQSLTKTSVLIERNFTKMDNVTRILDAILNESNYDNKIRPGHNTGEPLKVMINFQINSIGPIFEEKMIYFMDIYFRQYWNDSRLDFSGEGITDKLTLSTHTLPRIWKPDSFFLNGQLSHLHTITSLNKFLRIEPNGQVLLSMRLRIKAGCIMNLVKYPMDNQSCPLEIGSFSYTPQDVTYIWDDRKIKQRPYITLAQFLYRNYTLSKKIVQFHGNESREVLVINLKIRRMIGFYLLQIYVPCYLIVIISWVSFWINREATPARVMLGITTILTTTTIAMTGREGIAKVAYTTALDHFLLMCFFFVFSSLIEYTGVNYFTKSRMMEVNGEEQEAVFVESAEAKNKCNSINSNNKGPKSSLTTDSSRTIDYPTSQPRISCPVMFLHCLRGNTRSRAVYFVGLQQQISIVTGGHPGHNSVSRIDNFSRVAFPILFVFINLIYWTVLMREYH